MGWVKPSKTGSETATPHKNTTCQKCLRRNNRNPPAIQSLTTRSGAPVLPRWIVNIKCAWYLSFDTISGHKNCYGKVLETTFFHAISSVCQQFVSSLVKIHCGTSFGYGRAGSRIGSEWTLFRFGHGCAGSRMESEWTLLRWGRGCAGSRVGSEWRSLRLRA